MITPAPRPQAPWGPLSLIALAAAALVVLLPSGPVRAQDGINPTKAGKVAAQSIKEGVEGGSTAQAAQAAQAEVEGQPAEAPASEPPTAPPSAAPAAPAPNPLDQYHKRAATQEDKAAMTNRIIGYMRYHLEPNEVDIRQRTYEGGRFPWISRAPRQNPFDPQIVKPLPFHQLELPSTPPPPYYPPAGGIRQQSQQDAFQRFLDASKLSGIVTIGGKRTAIISFGKKTARFQVGDEFTEKEYVIQVRDITTDTVIVSTVDGSLSGILSLDLARNLFVGEGERSLIIISADEEEKKG